MIETTLKCNMCMTEKALLTSELRGVGSIENENEEPLFVPAFVDADTATKHICMDCFRALKSLNIKQ